MQKITDDLIERFLKGVCTKEEADAVSDYFEKHPEDTCLQEEFMMTDGEGGLPMGYSEDMLSFIQSATVTPVETEAPGRVRPMRRWLGAAAAAVILGICGMYLLKPAKKIVQNDVAEEQVASVEWVSKVNGGKRNIDMTLPDGSKVKLMPGTWIRYRKEFMKAQKREVVMSGVARFDIAKNDQLPFVVGCGGLSTYVLGTEFEVTAIPSGDEIRVRLYGGKVMVALDSLIAGNAKKSYYLVPGQELVFERNSHGVAVNAFSLKKESEEELVATTGTANRPDSVANWYMFNNQTLADVFEQLSVIYNVQIQYSKRDISKLYFIGKLEKRDSLHKIIQDIATLNHLTVKNENGNYIITRSKP